MSFSKILFVFLLFFCFQISNSQIKDTTKLDEVLIKGYKTVNGVGHLLDIKNGIIYAGKKNEVILVDSLDANKAVNNTRQILGRIPGLNIVETESSGFTANGIATRGLNPTQSVEMNTRQNGYNVSADIYGYNESYYLPPMEAVSRIEMVRGAASLQFGSQFGGLVNYVTKDAPINKPFEFVTSQTIGSYGLYNSFNSIGGNYKKWSYYSFIQSRSINGYRPNSEQTQFSAFGKIQYNQSKKSNFGLEYSLLRNKIKMPGGLTDDQFNSNSQQSTRARNWLKSPWNILTAYANFTPTLNSTLAIKSSFLFSSRALVWRNEDGGAEAVDGIDPATNEYVPREVGIEKMNNSTTEIRYSQSYNLGKQKSTFAGGIRQSYAWFKRLGGGEGTTGSDFDLSITGNWGYDLDFTTFNFAPFMENIFKISKNFTITPGIRFEYLRSTAKGHKEVDGDILISNEIRNRTFALGGIGLELKPTRNTSIYANFSQAFRPIDYSQLEPFGVTSRIDKNLQDSKGYNSDLGYRGTIKNYLNFDIGGFYLGYNKRIGVTLEADPITGDYFSIRKNIANSVHKGIESYVEFNIIKYLNPESQYGLSIFNSYAFIDAKYTTGNFKGKRVEAAARNINRVGLIFSTNKLSTTFQVNYVGDAFGDASNAFTSEDPVAGYIPSYTVLDFSSTYKINNFALKFGVNNIANKQYFTRRTDEYPGPGIIPAVGRSLYLGFTAKF
ncbi:TonB-dependent receptor [Flavobacterium sp. SUN052]|uniref:TonB-dependent receptor family protein n=1 Tax=Flavobacterium sp. SUN052 TaxID=3002441 RepID=UPI00237ED355|nr:TonB-dependent receptor [Flavobacterium sp. SUN052]MEC4005713.1 TonB-dependent receptor [Flavobacterium sp. SUN052]